MGFLREEGWHTISRGSKGHTRDKRTEIGFGPVRPHLPTRGVLTMKSTFFYRKFKAFFRTPHRYVTIYKSFKILSCHNKLLYRICAARIQFQKTCF